MDMVLVCLTPLAAYVAYSDFRWMRISNRVVILTLCVVVGAMLVFVPEDGWARVGAGTSVLAVGLLAFAGRLLGGGDVKFLAAVAPLVAPELWLLSANILAASLLISAGTILMLRRVTTGWASDWKGLDPRSGFPMGVAIGLAMILQGGLQIAATGT